MRHVFRLMILAFFVALGTWLFYIGREHQVFLDNKSIEIEGRNFKALKLVKVSVNGGDFIEFMPRDRDLVKVVGPVFGIKVEVMDEFGESLEKTIEKELKPGFSKDMMLSLPLLAAEREDYILPPPTVQQAAEPEEAPAPTEELPIPSSEPAAEPQPTETAPASKP